MYNIIRGRSGTDTNFYYDDWGRMISKDQGAYDATYEYRYGDKLYSVTSDFPGEGTVEYDYGSDGKRRTRETSTSYTWYNWAGWNVINEEGSGNVLERTYVQDPGKAVGTIMAHSQGTDPSTGTWRYYLQDNIGSTRNLTDDSKVEKGRYWYYPYGDVYAQSGEAIRYMFTGKEWDDDAQMYYFPFRYYSPGIGRWISREPSGLDGPNLYWYGLGNPSTFYDIGGLYGDSASTTATLDTTGVLADILVDVGYWTGRAAPIAGAIAGAAAGGYALHRTFPHVNPSSRVKRWFQQPRIPSGTCKPQWQNPFQPGGGGPPPPPDPEVVKAVLLLQAYLLNPTHPVGDLVQLYEIIFGSFPGG